MDHYDLCAENTIRCQRYSRGTRKGGGPYSPGERVYASHRLVTHARYATEALRYHTTAPHHNIGGAGRAGIAAAGGYSCTAPWSARRHAERLAFLHFCSAQTAAGNDIDSQYSVIYANARSHNLQITDFHLTAAAKRQMLSFVRAVLRISMFVSSMSEIASEISQSQNI
eukprot:6172009-Pleurochrysis_carterae.AAC.3